MLSRRHSSAMLPSPRRPSNTMRIFSSAEKCRHVARRMSLTRVSAGSFAGPDVCFIFAPDGYDEPDILRSRQPSICLKGADGAHPVVPPKTEYRLTPLGLKLREPASWLCEWAIKNEAVLDDMRQSE